MRAEAIRSALAFALLGAVCGGVLVRLPELLVYAQQAGLAGLAGLGRRLQWQFGAALLMGLLLMAALHAASPGGAAVAQRPGRFLLVLLPAAALCSWFGCALLMIGTSRSYSAA